MPILRSTHSSASTLPVTNAICGMSPSALVRGRRDWSGVSGLSTQGSVLIEICRRQRPSWMTTGMLVPTGTLVSVNLPSGPVVAVTSGSPVRSEPHWSQATPRANAVTVPLGM